MMKTEIGGLVAVLMMSSSAYAGSCTSIPGQVEEARGYLERISAETDFATAKKHMLKVREALDSISSAVKECGCGAALPGIRDAATKAELARGATGSDEFLYLFEQTAEAYDTSAEALSGCAAKPGPG